MKLVAQGAGPVNAAARMIDAPVYLIDVGLEQDTSDIEGVLTQKVIRGTHFGRPPMDDEVTAAAISVGMSVGKTLAGQGIEVIGLGNIGERSMLSALAVTTAIMKEDLKKASEKTGFALNISDVAILPRILWERFPSWDLLKLQRSSALSSKRPAAI